MAKELIIVVEDEADILDLVTYNLRKEGFTVLTARDGEEGLALARRRNPDLVLLDLMLPGLDGLEVCRRLKGDPVTSAIPVVMLTAKGEETDVVLGLGVGADDYVTKPFRPKELMARVRAVLRRGRAREDLKAGERVTVGDLVVDSARHQVLWRRAPVDLTATEFRLLHFLASHTGRVFTRDHLISRAIGEHAVVTDRNIDVHVRAIRKKLGDDFDCLETVRGVGYRLRAITEEV